jgi:hypothetical protein
MTTPAAATGRPGSGSRRLPTPDPTRFTSRLVAPDRVRPRRKPIRTDSVQGARSGSRPSEICTGRAGRTQGSERDRALSQESSRDRHDGPAARTVDREKCQTERRVGAPPRRMTGPRGETRVAAGCRMPSSAWVPTAWNRGGEATVPSAHPRRHDDPRGTGSRYGSSRVRWRPIRLAPPSRPIPAVGLGRRLTGAGVR